MVLPVGLFHKAHFFEAFSEHFTQCYSKQNVHYTSQFFFFLARYRQPEAAV